MQNLIKQFKRGIILSKTLFILNSEKLKTKYESINQMHKWKDGFDDEYKEI